MKGIFRKKPPLGDEQPDKENPEVYKEKKGKGKYKKVPRSLYYYHAKLRVEGERSYLDSKNFFYNNGNEKIEDDDIPDIVTFLALNARQEKGYVPPKHGNDLKDIWRRKSFVVILLDEENLRFSEKGIAVDDSNNQLPNYSFFDAENLEVEIPVGNTTVTRSAICFRNHMKKDHQGNDIGLIDNKPHEQIFKFKLYVEGMKRIGPFDAEGTNMGPPVPPPVIPM